MTNIKELLESYLLSHDLADSSQKQLHISVRAFEKFLNRASLLTDFTDDTINRFLRYLAEERLLSRATIRGQRVNLLTLWRYGWELELVAALPKRVRAIRTTATIPIAWTIEHMQALLGQADRLKGRFNYSRVERAKFWRAFILTAYDTGLRLGDLLCIRTGQIQADGRLTLVVSKTQRMLVCRVRESTLCAIGETYPPDRPLVFGSAISRRVIHTSFRALCKQAEMPTTGTKYLRRSSATHLETVLPGSASNHLGHSTPGLARKHYLDMNIIRRELPLPPPIFGTDS